MGLSLQRKGFGRVSLPLQAPSRKPSLLSKLNLAPATRSYSPTAFSTAFISRRWDIKTVISSANAETLAERGLAKGIPRRTGFVPYPEAYGVRAPKRGHREEETEGSPAGPNARSRTPTNDPERLPFTCTTA